MDKRALGRTGLELSLLGFGGFHLIEVPLREADRLLNDYLDRGGNYIETAESYGPHASELKIGESVARRRGEYVLATKTAARDRAGFLAAVEGSLGRLKTDCLDIVFMHAVQEKTEADTILAPGGALEGALEAQRAGKLRFIGITGHGRPDALLAAMRAHRFDVLMTGFNYFDRFNFPEIEGELLPACLAQGTGVLAMKPVADGYLYRSAAPAFRYALSLPVASVVAGMNSSELMDKDFVISESFTPMSEVEKDELYRTAVELGDYVCRFCGKCTGSGFDPQQIFRLEALFDRQMDSGYAADAAQYALQERLKHWFNQVDRARTEYGRAHAESGAEARLLGLERALPVSHRHRPEIEARAREALNGRAFVLNKSIHLVTPEKYR
jgi:aryl-alcohol dehydrogenase-like predicted oxidoreductase